MLLWPEPAFAEAQQVPKDDSGCARIRRVQSTHGNGHGGLRGPPLQPRANSPGVWSCTRTAAHLTSRTSPVACARQLRSVAPDALLPLGGYRATKTWPRAVPTPIRRNSRDFGRRSAPETRPDARVLRVGSATAAAATCWRRGPLAPRFRSRQTGPRSGQDIKAR